MTNIRTGKPTTRINGQVVKPRTLVDQLLGRSYTTPKRVPAAKKSLPTFKPKPSSNGIGVGP